MLPTAKTPDRRPGTAAGPGIICLAYSSGHQVCGGGTDAPPPRRRHHGGASFVRIARVEHAAQEVLDLLARWDPPIDIDAVETLRRWQANEGIGGDV